MFYFLRKKGYWYRSNFCGYTPDLIHAGFYSEDEVELYRNDPDVSIVRIDKRIVNVLENQIAVHKKQLEECEKNLRRVKLLVEVGK